MAVKIGAVTLTAAAVAVPCTTKVKIKKGKNKGKVVTVAGRFVLSATVTGTATTRKDTYDLTIYDDDLFDTALRTKSVSLKKAGKVLRPGGTPFVITTKFTLFCDKKCHIAGRLRKKVISTDENPADVYAYAKAPSGSKGTSANLKLTCTSGPPRLGVRPGSSSIERGEFRLATSKGKLPAGARLALGSRHEAPDVQFFPREIQPRVRMIAVGDEEIRFGAGTTLEWRLSGKQQEMMRTCDGRVVRYDATSGAWSLVRRFRLEDDRLTFSLRRGGTYGIAAGSASRRRRQRREP